MDQEQLEIKAQIRMMEKKLQALIKVLEREGVIIEEEVAATLNELLDEKEGAR